MRRAERYALSILLLALVGCSDRVEPPSDNGATPTPASTGTTAPPPVLLKSGVPDRLTVTTNEPFYSVRIDGDAVTLTGVDMPRRTLRVVGGHAAADTRAWNARDANGTLRVRVVRAPCEDDMSGAPRDFTATLTLSGTAVRGCGFVGTPAPPPDEAPVTAGTIPPRFVGRWNSDAATCTRPAAAIDGIRVTARQLWFHESVGTVQRVEPVGPDEIRVTADYEGEGERWTATRTLRVDGDRLTIVTDGRPFSRIRCPA